MLPRLGAFVRRFFLAAEHHGYAARRIELDDHIGALVDGPEVIVFVDANGVREGPGVEVVPDLADVSAVRPELKNLGRGGAIRGAGGVAAREDENMLFRIERD